ncbi:MFS transporter [Pinibacter aurantiacus]|uniref:MFS transporter n=1 Tax=Pinibacter aurantiacus TaxID=2851599 RepID=A0A9E2S3J8_9BACT|nr:MFS transporter [Pinibacter aurantiacus]MBV4355943.1 MFS transporter [Pinibacter aurantiacus]
MIDRRVLPLALGGLAIGTTEFTIMGLLPDMAASLHATIPQAGMLISAYALGVVVGAPLLTGIFLKQPPKKTLIFLTILFTLFNGLSIVAPGYSSMLLVRFLAGLPHGAFFGIGAVVASRIGGKGKEARYISMMFTGLTLANLLMVPLVTYIGHTFHWRWYFAVVTLIGTVTLAFISSMLPDIQENKDKNFREEMQFIKSSQVWFVLAITAIGFGGLFTWFSYITPLMTVVSGISAANMAWVMVLAGGGMVVGNVVGGMLSDRIGATRATIVLLASMMIVLLLVFFFSANTLVALVLTFICGGLSMSTSAPLNIMIMKAAPRSQMMAAAFMQAAFNMANSAGAYFGGIPLKHGYAYNYPSLVGVYMTLCGLLICIVYSIRFSTKKEQLEYSLR